MQQENIINQRGPNLQATQQWRSGQNDPLNRDSRHKRSQSYVNTTSNLIHHFQDDSNYKNRTERYSEDEKQYEIPDYKNEETSKNDIEKENKQKFLNEKKMALERDYFELFQEWKDWGYFQCLYAMFGLIVACMMLEYDLQNQVHGSGKYIDLADHDIFSEFCRVVILLTTVLSIYCLFKRHIAKMKWINRYFQRQSNRESKVIYKYHGFVLDPKTKATFNDDHPVHVEKKLLTNKRFMVELLILCLIPIPFYNFKFKFHQNCVVEYCYNHFIIAFMWLRCYFLIRVYFNYQKYSDAYSKYMCWTQGFSSNTSFNMKCQMKNQPGRLIIFLLFTTIFSFAHIMRIFELPLLRNIDDESSSELQSFANSVWCIVITMTTVGYGDISPKTILGRMIAMLTALWGAFLISVTVYCITTHFNLSQQQEMAINRIGVTKKAACTIQSSLRYFLAKKNYLEFINKPENQNLNNAYPNTQKMLIEIMGRNEQVCQSEFYKNINARDPQTSRTNDKNILFTVDKFEIKNYYKHECKKGTNEGKMRELRLECLKLEDQMLTQVIEFKQERMDLEKFKQQQNGEKNLIKKMMKYEMINVAERIENIESIIQKQIAEQKVMMKMILYKFDEAKENNKTCPICAGESRNINQNYKCPTIDEENVMDEIHQTPIPFDTSFRETPLAVTSEPFNFIVQETSQENLIESAKQVISQLDYNDRQSLDFNKMFDQIHEKVQAQVSHDKHKNLQSRRQNPFYLSQFKNGYKPKDLNTLFCNNQICNKDQMPSNGSHHEHHNNVQDQKHQLQSQKRNVSITQQFAYKTSKYFDKSPESGLRLRKRQQLNEPLIQQNTNSN